MLPHTPNKTPKRGARMRTNVYAVTKADVPENAGIYIDWTACSKVVLHVSGARPQGAYRIYSYIYKPRAYKRKSALLGNLNKLIAVR